MQPATIDPTLDLCTRYPLRLGGLRQCGIRSLPNTSTHGQHWESNSRPSDLESNALSTRPHKSTCLPVHIMYVHQSAVGCELFVTDAQMYCSWPGREKGLIEFDACHVTHYGGLCNTKTSVCSKDVVSCAATDSIQASSIGI